MTYLGHELIPNSDKRESDKLLSITILNLGDKSELDVVAMKATEKISRRRNRDRY